MILSLEPVRHLGFCNGDENMNKKWRCQAWFSIASDTGLSLISFGSPGLKTEMDEQIFTGGTTAVVQLLGEEIGATGDSFVGGGDTSRFGRFKVTHEDHQLIAQFLLVSLKERIPEPLVEFSREFILAFMNVVVKTQAKELKSGFQQISHRVVQNEFMKALTISRKKMRVESDDEFLKAELEAKLRYVLSDISSIMSLRSMTDDDRPLREILQDLRKNRSKYVEKLGQEIFLSILSTNPLPVMLFPRLNDVKDFIAEETRKYLPEVVQTPEFHKQFENLVEEVKKSDIPLILRSTDMTSTKDMRGSLKAKISAKIAERLLENHPLALIASPEMSFGTVSVETATVFLVDVAVEKYDFGSTLRVLAVELSGDPLCGLEIGEFMRYFSSRFPEGISTIGWTFLRYIFDMLTSSRKEITDLLASVELPESHKKTLKKELKGRRKDSLEGVTVALGEGGGDDVHTFFNAISASVAHGVAQFFDAVIGTYEKPGRLYHDYAYRFEDFCAHSSAIYATFRNIEVLVGRGGDIPYLADAIPRPETLMEADKPNSDFNEMMKDPKVISQLWKSDETVSKAFEYSGHSLFDSRLSEFQKQHHMAYDQIESLLRAVDNTYGELEKGKKPTIADLVKKCEDIKAIPKMESGSAQFRPWFADIEYLQDSKLELRRLLEKAKDILNDKYKGKSIDKKSTKERTKILKVLERLEKSRTLADTRILKSREEFEKRFVREVSKARKDLKKLQRELSYKVVRLSNSKNGLSVPSTREFLETVQERMRSIGDEDDYISELGSPAWLYAWASILQRPPESALNKAFRDALSVKTHKKVPLVREIVKEITDSEQYELAEILRDKLRTKTRRILNKMISHLSEARPWFLTRDPTVFRVLVDGKDEAYLVKIGEFPEKYLTHNVMDWFKRWKEAEYIFQDKTVLLCSRVVVDAAIGDRARLSEALARTGVVILQKRYKTFLDILETSCNLLSSSKKAAFQGFLTDLEKTTATAVE